MQRLFLLVAFLSFIFPNAVATELKAKPTQPIVRPPLDKPKPPQRPGYRPPVVVLPVLPWQGNYPNHQWNQHTQHYWIYRAPESQAPLPSELITVEFSAEQRAELVLVDGLQQVVFDGWLGMGDQRQWQLRHPATVYLSQLEGIRVQVDQHVLDLSDYPQHGAVSLSFGDQTKAETIAP